jgi:hypothetical protein
LVLDFKGDSQNAGVSANPPLKRYCTGRHERALHATSKLKSSLLILEKGGAAFNFARTARSGEMEREREKEREREREARERDGR